MRIGCTLFYARNLKGDNAYFWAEKSAGSMDKYVVIGVALQKWEAGSSRTWERICDNDVDADQQSSSKWLTGLEMARNACLPPILTASGLCLACMMNLESR